MSLEDIREKKTSKGVYVVVGLLLVGMAGFGTSQFGGLFNGSEKPALELGSSTVSMREFNRILASNRQNYPTVEDSAIEELTVSQLSKRLALENYLNEHPLTTSNAAIDKLIVNNPAFFENGKFSEDAFRRVVAIDPKSYRKLLAQDMAMNAFQNAIAETGVVSDVEITPYQELQGLERDILVAKLSKQQFIDEATAELTDEDIQAFYDANKSNYMTDDKVSLEYVELNPQEIANAINVSDEDIAQSALPSRNVKYYLFTDSETAKKAYQVVQSGDSVESIKTQFADQLEDSGTLDNIAAVADENSALPQKAVDAIFALSAKGQLTTPLMVDDASYLFELVSEPRTVLTDTEKQTAKKKLQKQRASDKVSEINKKLEKAYYSSQSPNLQTLSEATGLPVKQTGLLSLKSGEGVLGIKELLEAIVASDKQVGKLQDFVSVGNGEHIIIYKLTAFEKAQQKPLSEVSEQVRVSAIAEKAEIKLQETVTSFEEQVKKEGLETAAHKDNYPTQALGSFDGNAEENGLLDTIAAISIIKQSPQLGDKNPQSVRGINGDAFVYVNTDVRLGGQGVNEVDAKTNQQLKTALENAIGRTELISLLDTIMANSAIKMSKGLLDKNK